MSFINMMASDVWSDADITRRTEAMLRTEFSQEAETILNRKVLGISLGTYEPTAQDQADIARYDQVAKAVQAEGVAARADMALLLQVFPVEEAQRRLDRVALAAAWQRLQLPEVEPELDEDTGEVTNAEAVERDRLEREAARIAVAPHLVPDPDFTPEEGEDQDVEAPLILDPEAVTADEAARAEAQGVIDGAAPEVLELFEARKGSA